MSKMEGILHVYHASRSLLLFEHTPRPSPSSSTTSPTSSSASSPSPPNTLLFVGGLYDNFLSPWYTTSLSALFPRHLNQQWSVMHIQLSSAGKQWGISDLHRDTDEIATAINYIRSTLRPSSPTPSPIVLLGHSTGCQDVLHYLSAPTNPKTTPLPPIQGAILQAPVSDRDAMNESLTKNLHHRPAYTACLALADETPEDRHSATLLPLHLSKPIMGNVPITIARFLSLASPDSPENPGPDDLFSADATVARLKATFGGIAGRRLLQPSSKTKPTLLALISGADEHVPAHIDKAQLMTKWTDAMVGSGVEMDARSGLIADAKHGLDGEGEPQRRAREVVFRSKVLAYLEDMVGGVDGEAWEVVRRAEGDTSAGEEGEEKEVEKGVGDMKL